MYYFLIKEAGGLTESKVTNCGIVKDIDFLETKMSGEWQTHRQGNNIHLKRLLPTKDGGEPQFFKGRIRKKELCFFKSQNVSWINKIGFQVVPFFNFSR